MQDGQARRRLIVVQTRAAALTVGRDCCGRVQDQGLWGRAPVLADRELREVGRVVDVLVVYATKNGSTRQVAEAITEALREAGAQVSAGPARTAREPVAGYDLVVVGAPLYSGRWHRDAHRFLKRHRRELAAVPVAVFGMGPRNDTAEAWQRSLAQLDRALARRSWLNPVAVTVFGGVDPPGRSKGPRRDLRNWRAIDTWATDTLAATARTRQDHSTAGQ